MLVDPAAHQQPQPADAIIVLSGTPADRWLEAYELWRSGVAPSIALSPGYVDEATAELQRRGLDVPRDVDIATRLMTGPLGVPRSAVIELPGPLDNTAQEATAVREAAARYGWTRVIIVTSTAHTRRTGIAMRRVLEPAGVHVQVRASRFDRFQASRWWRSRGSSRWVLTEWPKLVAYRLGLAG